jgi:hypothetical protein
MCDVCIQWELNSPAMLVATKGACIRIIITSVGLAIAPPMVPAVAPAAILIHKDDRVESSPPNHWPP